MVLLDFKNKVYDGPYEVAEIEIQNEREKFRGILYFPPKEYKKPHPLIIYFHGFPQLLALTEIVKDYKYILDSGFAFLIFNFRGYRYSEGKISIKNSVSDALKIIEYIKKMSENQIFDLNNIKIIAHDFGAFIGLILCSRVKIVNKLILISPIIDLSRHVHDKEFLKVLEYINHFLPGNIKGIEDINKFITMTKKELSKKQFQTKIILKKLKNKELKVISGEIDKITPSSEIMNNFDNIKIPTDISIIKDMDHECIEEKDIKEIENEIKDFLNI